MKRVILLLLALLLLSGCAAKPKQVEYAGETLTVDREKGTVSDGVHEYKYTYENEDVTLVYPNGVVYEAVFSGLTEAEWASIESYAAPRALVFAVEEAEASRNSNALLILAGIVLLGVSVFELWKPNFFWELRHGWKFKEMPEPSEEYLEYTRLYSICTAILGALLIIAGFLIP